MPRLSKPSMSPEQVAQALAWPDLDKLEIDHRKERASRGNKISYSIFYTDRDGKLNLSGTRSWECYGNLQGHLREQAYNENKPVGVLLHVDMPHRLTRTGETGIASTDVQDKLLAASEEYWTWLFEADTHGQMKHTHVFRDDKGYVRFILFSNLKVPAPLLLNWMIACRYPYYTLYNAMKTYTVMRMAGAEIPMAIALATCIHVQQPYDIIRTGVLPADDVPCLVRWAGGGDGWLNGKGEAFSRIQQSVEDFMPQLFWNKTPVVPKSKRRSILSGGTPIPNNYIWTTWTHENKKAGDAPQFVLGHAHVIATDQTAETTVYQDVTVFGRVYKNPVSQARFGYWKLVAERIAKLVENPNDNSVKFNLNGRIKDVQQSALHTPNTGSGDGVRDEGLQISF